MDFELCVMLGSVIPIPICEDNITQGAQALQIIKVKVEFLDERFLETRHLGHLRIRNLLEGPIVREPVVNGK